MKSIYSNQAICEMLLILYFSKKREAYLSVQVIGLLDEFVQFIRVEDEFNNTQNYETLLNIYSNKSYDDRKDLLEYIASSEATFCRLRSKTKKRLEKHLKSILE